MEVKKSLYQKLKKIIDAVEQCNSQKYNDNIDLITLEVSEEFNNCVMINIKYNCDKVESLVLEDGFEFNFNKNYLFETGIFKCLLEDIKSTIDKTNKELSKQNLTPEEYYSQIPEVEFKHGEENYHIYWSFTFNKYMIDYVRCNKCFARGGVSSGYTRDARYKLTSNGSELLKMPNEIKKIAIEMWNRRV